MWIVLGILGAVVLGVVWACLRVASQLARYEEWDDDPLLEQKREHWK